MPCIRCEKVQTYVVPANGEEHPVVVYELGHFTQRPAIQVSRGQWMLAAHFGAVQSLDKDLSAAAGELKVEGPKPLWHFAPYRIGAEQRPDVVAERSLGLCKYLEHVLKFTEVPAPKELVQMFDDFINRYWVGNLEQTLRLATSTAVRTPPTPRTAGKAAIMEFLGRVRPGQAMQDTPVELPSLRSVMQRFKSLKAAGIQLAQGELLSAVKPLGGAVATQPHAKPFIEVVPPSKVPQEACPLCRRHLRQKDTGCIRLRSCGHALHGECFNGHSGQRLGTSTGTAVTMALMSSSDRFPNVPRTGCPKCGECWAEWALFDNRRCQSLEAPLSATASEREQLSTMLGLGMSSRGAWGHIPRRLGLEND